MGIADAIARFLRLTVGNGSPEYRTNPITGQRYSYQELSEKAQAVGSTYKMPVNIYLNEPQHIYDAQG